MKKWRGALETKLMKMMSISYLGDTIWHDDTVYCMRMYNVMTLSILYAKVVAS